MSETLANVLVMLVSSIAVCSVISMFALLAIGNYLRHILIGILELQICWLETFEDDDGDNDDDPDTFGDFEKAGTQWN